MPEASCGVGPNPQATPHLSPRPAPTLAFGTEQARRTLCSKVPMAEITVLSSLAHQGRVSRTGAAVREGVRPQGHDAVGGVGRHATRGSSGGEVVRPDRDVARRDRRADPVRRQDRAGSRIDLAKRRRRHRREGRRAAARHQLARGAEAGAARGEVRRLFDRAERRLSRQTVRAHGHRRRRSRPSSSASTDEPTGTMVARGEARSASSR